MKKQGNPEEVKLTRTEAEALCDRVRLNQLTSNDTHIIIGVIQFNLWLRQTLSSAHITLKRLKSLFGLSGKTEKKSL